MKQHTILVLFIITILTISSCSGGTLSGKVIAGTPTKKGESTQPPKQETPTDSDIPEPTANSGEATEQELETIEEIETITEVKTYEASDKCSKDEIGVVRVFDHEGKKTVYRPFCDGNSVILFECEGDIARSHIKKCPGGCKESRTRIGSCK